MDRNGIEKLADLARLNVDKEVVEEVATSITGILALVDELKAADTEGVEPMSHPQDGSQRLRADKVIETDQRGLFQAIAPQTEGGLYLVPKVIE